jgi:hypothetical protein
MKHIIKSTIKHNILSILLVGILLLMMLMSCEQEEAVAELNAAPGGGTVSTYKAYALSGATEDDVYGRIVFYKDNSGNTLVQVGLYNTEDEVLYSNGVYSGDEAAETAVELMPFYPVSGTTGEFSTNKFYVIADETFYDGLSTLDAHFKLMKGEVLISKGNIGMNAKPVAESD